MKITEVELPKDEVEVLETEVSELTEFTTDPTGLTTPPDFLPYEIYQGYIKTKGKKPLDKLKSDTYRKFSECINFDSFGGILKNDIIVVDVDEKTQADLLYDIVSDFELDCYIVQTTRGYHFIFKNPSVNGQLYVNKCYTNVQLACGIRADIKIGSKPVAHPIKINGLYRDVPWRPLHELQPLPKWLTPIKSNLDLFNLSEGEGRNDTLYKYILSLNRYGLSKDETRETLNIINKYIFKDPLNETEIETITRDEAFPKSTFFDKNNFLHDEFAKYLVNEHKIKRINGQLHTFNGQVYVAGKSLIEAEMIKLIPSLKKLQRNEVLSYIDLLCNEDNPLSNANLIAFKNGIYDVETDTLQDFSPDVIITNQIPHNYNPNAYDENVDNILNKLSCNDTSIRSILEEATGYTFYRRNELSKTIYIFYGDKANGKSTFISMLRSLYGKDNYSALSVDELCERFSLIMASSKLANFGDDLPTGMWNDYVVSNLKKISSGNIIKAEAKGKDAISFEPYCKQFYSTNNLAFFKDISGALMRRIVIIPMNASFTKNSPDFDPYIISKITTESSMEYLIKLGIQGLKRVLENNDFTSSKQVEDITKQVEKDNNHILEWVEDEVGTEHILCTPINDLFHEYRLWCLQSGFGELSRTKFTRDMGIVFGLKSHPKKVDGELVRYFIRK